MFDTIIK